MTEAEYYRFGPDPADHLVDASDYTITLIWDLPKVSFSKFEMETEQRRFDARLFDHKRGCATPGCSTCFMATLREEDQ